MILLKIHFGYDTDSVRITFFFFNSSNYQPH